MKKFIIFFILPLLLTLPAAINFYTTVSGSTFTMPSGNTSDQEDNGYHKYNIENNNTGTVNKYNMHDNNITNKKDIPADNNKNNSVNNKSTPDNIKQNIQNNNTSVPHNTQDNNITNNKNNPDGIKGISGKSKTNKKNNNNKVKNKTNNNKTNTGKMDNNNSIDNNTTNNNLINKKTDNNKTTPDITPGNNNINNSTIEFSKHFIKIPAGKTASISLKIKSKNLSSKNIIYKSDNNSIATYSNNKITGIKKGFTTIIITLPDGIIKAACPVKVI